MANAIRRNPEGVSRRRSFPTIRQILIVRFDPGTTDDFDVREIRDEADPDPFVEARRKERFNRIIGISQPTGRAALSRTDARAALTAATVNLADSIAKVNRGDGYTRTFDVQALKSQRSVTTYRKANELDLTFDWRALPFDSRLIRAILVLHYEGTTSADAWGIGTRDPRGGEGVPGEFVVPATGPNLRFVGTVDEISDAHGEGGDVLSMKGRDLTSLFIDTKWSPKREVRIPAGATILEAVQVLKEMDDLFDLVRGPFLRSENRAPNLDPNRYPRLAVPAKERHRQDASGGRGFILRRPPKTGGKSSYWDIITELCVSHGLRPVVEQDKLILVEPRTLYSRTPEVITSPGTPTFPTVYRQRIGDVGSTVRRMVYGSNVTSIRFHRKLGRIKAPAVEVQSLNPDADDAAERFLTVRHPPKTTTGRRANNVDATGKKPSETVHVVQIHGVVDKTQLKSVAEQIYEGMGRGELGVAVETDDVASFSDHPAFDPNEDPDLLAIQAGDPIRFLVASTFSSSGLFTLSELQSLIAKVRTTARSSGQRAEFRSAIGFLVNQGWRQRDAEQFVKVAASANLPREFRVVSASITYDDGFNVQLDCRDYIRARADPNDVSQTRGDGAVLPGSPVPGTGGGVVT